MSIKTTDTPLNNDNNLLAFLSALILCVISLQSIAFEDEFEDDATSSLLSVPVMNTSIKT